MSSWERACVVAGYYFQAWRLHVRHFFGWFVCKWAGHYYKFSAHKCMRCGKKAWWKD